jgi:hypothetical protein
MSEPRTGDGWDDILEEDEPLREALETDGEGRIDHENYGFDSTHDMIEYIDTNGFVPGGADYERRKNLLHNQRWEVPQRLKKLQSIDDTRLDPTAETSLHVTGQPANRQDADTKYTLHFAAYDPEGEFDVNFYISTSWYDTPPEQTNMEDIF